jgi:hypothetical protein
MVGGKFKVGGVFTVAIWRQGTLVHSIAVDNTIFVPARALMMRAYMKGDFPTIDTVEMGIFSGSFNTRDSIDSHAGWTEANAGRVAWNPVATGRYISGNQGVWNITAATANNTVMGIFTASNSILFSAAPAFLTGSAQRMPIFDGDVVTAIYTVTILPIW